MREFLASLLGISMALIAGGCAQPAASPEAPDMREADMAAIMTLEREWLKAFEAKDADKVASFYAEDASVLLPNMPIVNGRESARNTMSGMFADPNFFLTFDSTKIEAARSSDIAYSQGTYTMATTDAKMKGNVATEKGKFVTVFKKQEDGTWKVVADIVNADGPATSAPPNLSAPRP